MRVPVAKSGGTYARREGAAAQHRRLLEELGPPSVLLGADGEMLHASAGVALYLERSHNGAGARVLDRVPPELRGPLAAALDQARRTGETVRTNTHHVRVGSQRSRVTVEVRPARDGKLLLLFDARAEADPESEAQADLFTRLAELSPEAILVNAGGRWAYVNAAGARLLGALRPDEILGRSPFDLIEPEAHAALRERIRIVQEEHRNTKLQEFRWRRLDGSWVDVEVVGGPIDWRGTPAIQVLARDISERKRHEREMALSDLRYKSLFESIDEGFCVIEVLFDARERPFDYRFLEVNPAFEKHTGIADAVGLCMRDIAPAHEEHWFDIYGRVATTGDAVRFEKEAKDLGRFFDVYAFRIGLPSERQVAVLFNDITERKRLEEERRLAAVALAEAGRRKDEYLAMLGHELRNPLAAIRTATEFVQRVEPPDGRVQRAVGVLDRQTRHMARILDDLLEVSRIAQGKVHLVVERVDVRDVLEKVIEDHASEIAASGLSLERAFAEAPLFVDGDEVRLAQVFGNLVGNALKFTRAPGTITVSVQRTGDRARISVADTGVGIRPEMLARIFDAFHQEPQDFARSAGGLGLGLALAKGLVDLHRGTIAARSDGPGQGAEVEVELPLAPHVESAPRVDDREMAASHEILVVEDNADAAEMLRELLELRGHRATVVDSGTKALEALRAGRFDVVLCDLGLPTMSGHEVARAVRADPALRSVALVAVTGYGQPEDRARTSEAGFDAHLVKPVALDALDEALVRLGKGR